MVFPANFACQGLVGGRNPTASVTWGMRWSPKVWSYSCAQNLTSETRAGLYELEPRVKSSELDCQIDFPRLDEVARGA